MEGVGASFGGDQWGCLGGSMYTTTTEEADFMAELLGTFSSLPNDQLGSCVNPSPLIWTAAAHDSIINSSDRDIFFPGNYNYLTDCQHVLAGDSNNSALSMDFGFGVSVHNHDHEKEKNFSSKNDQYGLNTNKARDGDCPWSLLPDMPTVLIPSLPALMDDQDKKKKKKMPENPKKRTRDSVADHVEKNKSENVRKKKTKKNQSSSTSSSDHIEEKENINVVNGQQQQQQSSNSCCSEEEEEEESSSINASGQEITNNGESTLNLNGKTRASRGSATDPQSLYARKRRERINERLRILQNLVPNGTKVDISTMLEEAVQYVKFLQLQIKLLSSDDLWMYAPLAYNGMDIGLDLKIAMPRK